MFLLFLLVLVLFPEFCCCATWRVNNDNHCKWSFGVTPAFFSSRKKFETMRHYLKICQQRWSWTGGCLLLPLSQCPCPSQDSLITLKILLISQCITGVCATIEFLNTAVALIRHLGWLCLLSSGKSKLCGVQRVGQLPFSKHRSHRCHVSQVHNLEETIIRALH